MHSVLLMKQNESTFIYYLFQSFKISIFVYAL